MFTFEYTLIDASNALHKGVIRAISKKHAAHKLVAPDYSLVTLRKTIRLPFWNRAFLHRVSPMDRIVFTRNLMTMLHAGLTITDALASSREQASNTYLKRIILDAEKCIAAGEPLSNVLGRYPRVFAQSYIAMIRIGERGGKLVQVLQYLTTEMENDLRLRRKIRGALVYPSMILVTMVVMIVLMMLFVIPRVEMIYEESNVSLPLFTAALVSISNFVAHYGAYLLAILVALYVVFKSEMRRSLALRRSVHRLLLRLPLIGPLTKKINLTIISGSLSMLTHAGLSIDEGLQLAGRAATNVLYQEAIQRAVPFIKRGVQLSVIFKGSPELFLPVFSRMVVTGEQTGNLDDMFAHVSAYYDEDISNWTSNMSSMLEPILLVITGVVIGAVVFAIIFPLWNFANII